MSEPAIIKTAPSLQNKRHIALCLLAAPVAWVALMAAGSGLSSYTCYPHNAPLAAPMWTWVKLALSGAGVILFGLSFMTCIGAWRGFRKAERNGGWRRFLYLIAVMSSSLFTTAVFFNTVTAFMVPLCPSWP